VPGDQELVEHAAMSVHGYAIGDLHLNKSNLRAMFDEPDMLILGMAERIFKTALKNGVRLVVFLGDICDTHLLPDHTRTAFIRLLKRYDGKLDIRIYLGNHDVAESSVHSLHTLEVLCELGFYETVKIFTEHTVEEYEGVTLEYLAWPAEKPKHKKSVCFGHYEVKGSTRDNGRVVKEGHDSTFKFDNQFVQGHLHTPHSVGNHWYVGTMAQKSFGEKLPKGYGEFKARMVNGKLKFQKRHVSWQPAWNLQNVVLESQADVKKYPALLETFGPLARVKLFVADGLKVPEDFLQLHPEIVNRLDYAGTEELERLKDEELQLETQSVVIDHESVLPMQLKQMGATKLQIARGLEIINGFKQVA
jgi:hypothetical protein